MLAVRAKPFRLTEFARGGAEAIGESPSQLETPEEQKRSMLSPNREQGWKRPCPEVFSRLRVRPSLWQSSLAFGQADAPSKE